MRAVRLILYLAVGLFLGASAALSYAETKPAIPNSSACTLPICDWDTPVDQITSGCYKLGDGRWAFDHHWQSCGAGRWDGEGCDVDAAGKPTGGWSYNASTHMCSRPDCAAGESRDPVTGVCISKCDMYPGTSTTPIAQPANCSCPAGTQWVGGAGCRKKCTGSNAGDTANAGFDINLPAGQSEGCFGGCGVQHTAGVFYIFKDGSSSAPATYTGWACSGNGEGTAPTADNQPAPNNPAVEENKLHTPKCAAGEGVVTSSSGNVMCLPAGTVPTPSTPKVEKKTTTETYPDNSTKVTETTTTKDPYTNATHVITTATGSGGQAGTGTTTTSTGTSSTNGAGGAPGAGAGEGDGACDPKSDFCGGPGTSGLYVKKDKTVQSVLDTFRTGLQSSPIGQAATGFLNVSTPGGSCPNWTVTVEWFNWTHNLGQYFCTSTALGWLDLFGWVIIAVVSFTAFRWAIL